MLSAADGRTLAFHSQNISALEGQGNGEITHAAVKVKDPLSGHNAAKLKDNSNEVVILSKVDLAEAAGFPAEQQVAMAAGNLGVMNAQDFSGGSFFAVAIGPHKGVVFASEKDSLNRRTVCGKSFGGDDLGRPRFALQVKNDNDLAGKGIFLQFHLGGHCHQLLYLHCRAKRGQCGIEGRSGQEAGSYRHEAVRVEGVESKYAAFAHLQAKALTIGELFRSTNRFGDEGQAVAHFLLFTAFQEFADNRRFYLQLAAIVTLLQIAAAALTEIPARCYPTSRVRREDLEYSSKDMVFFCFFNAYQYRFAGQGVADKEDLACRQVSKAITAIDNFFYGNCFRLHLLSLNG